MPIDTKADAAQRLKCPMEDLEHYVWTEGFPNIAGPFHGIGGPLMTTCEIEAWASGISHAGLAALYCKGKYIRTVRDFCFYLPVWPRKSRW